MTPPAGDDQEGRDALAGAALAARNWPITLAIVAIIVGGVEMRLTLAEAVEDLRGHVASAGHPDTQRHMAVADAQSARVDHRLEKLEQGQEQMARQLAENGAVGAMVLEELREMRRKLEAPRR